MCAKKDQNNLKEKVQNIQQNQKDAGISAVSTARHNDA